MIVVERRCCEVESDRRVLEQRQTRTKLAVKGDIKTDRGAMLVKKVGRVLEIKEGRKVEKRKKKR